MNKYYLVLDFDDTGQENQYNFNFAFATKNEAVEFAKNEAKRGIQCVVVEAKTIVRSPTVTEDIL